MEITKDVHYVGVNDRRTTQFEGLWPLPYGVSYNSYLVVGTEKVALIDTVEVCYCEAYLKKIRAVLGDRKIDYLVINHMEPDHSGSLPFILSHYPDITFVGNKKTFEMIDGFYGTGGNRHVVAEGDTLDLGGHTLSFYLIPMVHWPETMVTYDATTSTLFAGDAFGCFGALNGGCVDKDINTDIYWDEMRRYYSNIVGKYGAPVQRALKKLGGLELKHICSTHGPVWVENVPRVIDIYDRLSRYEAEEGVVVAYGTMYGNTEAVAEVIAEELCKQGIKNVVLHDVSRTHHSFIISDIFKYKGLIVGSCTYNTQLFPEMEALLSKIAARDMKDRYIGYFGSYTWASAAYKKLGEYVNTLNFEVIGDAIEMKQTLNASTEDAARAMARAMTEKLKSERK